MPKESTRIIHKYLRHDKHFPHVWCPGCGNGIVMGALIRAIDKMAISKDDIVLASGIGCSGRMPVYMDFNTLHATHGRVLTFATGIKLARPHLKVIAIMGDGDAVSIGGNHFIHAARRNIDITAIIINNEIYGMTGGQYSPATPYGSYAATAVYGNIEHSFSISDLAITAGGSFIARCTVFHSQMMENLIEKAIHKKGFSVVEVLSHCHTQYGRRNNTPSAVTMMKRFKEDSVRIEDAKGILPESLKEKIVIGVLADVHKPVYTEEYDKIRKRAVKKLEAEGNGGKQV